MGTSTLLSGVCPLSVDTSRYHNKTLSYRPGKQHWDNENSCYQQTDAFEQRFAGALVYSLTRWSRSTYSCCEANIGLYSRDGIILAFSFGCYTPPPRNLEKCVKNFNTQTCLSEFCWISCVYRPAWLGLGRGALRVHLWREAGNTVRYNTPEPNLFIHWVTMMINSKLYFIDEHPH